MQFDMLGPFRTSALRARPAAVLSPLTRLGLPLAIISFADSDAPRSRSMRLSARRAESMLFKDIEGPEALMKAGKRRITVGSHCKMQRIRILQNNLPHPLNCPTGNYVWLQAYSDAQIVAPILQPNA